MNIKTILYYLVFFCILLFSRSLFLDCDVPSWNLSHFQPIDEFYYSITAFNYYHLGSPTSSLFTFFNDKTLPFMEFPNFIVFGFLLVFGNTYLGLRFGSVLISSILILLFFVILKSTINKKANSKIIFHVKGFQLKIHHLIILFPLLYLLTDFSFLLASRVFESTIYRSLALVVITFLFMLREKMKFQDSNGFTFLIGFAAAFAVLFIYIYNIYLIFASITTLIIHDLIHKKQKSIILRDVFYFTFGLISLIALFDLYLRLGFNLNLVDYIFRLSNSSERIFSINDIQKFIISFNTILKRIPATLFSNLSVDVIRNNYSLLVIYIFSFPLFLIKVIKEKRSIDVFILVAFFFILIQTFFENSYPERRHTTYLPIILLVIVFSIDFLLKICNESINNFKLISYYLFVLCLISILFATYCFSISFDSLAKDYLLFGTWFTYINLIITLFCILSLFLFSYLFTHNRKIKKGFVILFCLIVIVPNVFLSLKYIYLFPKYRYKEAMVDFSKKTNSGVVIGRLAYGFRLYNNYTPVLNFYSYLHNTGDYKKIFNKILSSDSCKYIIDFRDIDNTPLNSMKMVSGNKDYKLERDTLYQIGDSVYIQIFRNVKNQR